MARLRSIPDNVTVHYSAPDGQHSLDTFNYIVQNSGGETSIGQMEIVIGPQELTDEAPQVDVLDPTVQHTEYFTSHHALVKAEFPVQIFTGTLEAQDIFFFSYMATVTPTEHTVMPTSLVRLGDFEFELDTYLDHTMLEDIHFAPAVTLTIHYDPAVGGQSRPRNPAAVRLGWHCVERGRHHVRRQRQRQCRDDRQSQPFWQVRRVWRLGGQRLSLHAGPVCCSV